MTQVKAISFISPVLVSLTLISQVNGNISFVDQHNSDYLHTGILELKTLLLPTNRFDQPN